VLSATGSNTNPKGGVLPTPPSLDGVNVCGGFRLPSLDARIFVTWFDRDNPDALLGVAERDV
jgi:hypothetical protein